MNTLENQEQKIEDVVARTTVRTPHVEKTVQYHDPIKSLIAQRLRDSSLNQRPSYVYLKLA